MSTAPSAFPHRMRPPQPATTDGGAAAERGGTTGRLAGRVPPELLLLLAVAAALNLINLGVNGNANEYYSAAVRSMTESWSNFFFGSFDPAGLQTVDKPPLALWVQAASAKVFGFSTWSFLVPQALMGVATTALTYDLVRRPFGRAGGFAAGLALATTPTAVAVFRHNNPDALLMLCVTAALWAVVRAFEQPSRTRWLVMSGAAIGLAFEAKMAAGLMAVPAIFAAWLWVRPLGLGRAVRQLAAFSASAAAVGLAWPLAVWLTPAESRPWISGTSDNSIWTLIFGYNGLGRVFGQSGGPGGGGPGGGANLMFGGDAGPLRLLNQALGSQGGWLLGVAVGSILVLLIATRLRRTDPRTGWLIATAGTFATTAVAFSFASGIFHPYYVSALAPFTAALFGAGLATMLGHRTGARTTDPDSASPEQDEPVGATAEAAPARAEAEPTTLIRAVGGLSLVAGAVTEWVVLGDATQLGWLQPVLLVGTVVAGLALLLSTSRRVRLGAVGGAAALLLAAPTVWAVQTPGHATSGTFPTGGPASTADVGGPGGARGFGRPGGGPGAQNGRFGGPPAGTSQSTFTPPAGGFAPPGLGGNAGAAPGAGGTAPTAPGGTPPSAAGGVQPGGTAGAGPGGGGFSGDQSAVNEALAYIKTHGGGTLALSGQSGAAPAILSSGANIAGVGGFSGRESEVSVSWFADRVATGEIRWALTTSGGLRDARTGSSTVMGAVSSACQPVESVDGLYDCQGQDSALRSAAS